MDLNLGNIIANSFKYPFGDLKHLGFACVLFVLTLILPIGIFIENEITCMIGLVALLVFILIAPGYLILVVNSGINESLEIPSIKVGRSIVNTFKLLVLHICYIAVPSIIALVLMLFATGIVDFPKILIDSLLSFTFTFKLIEDFIIAILTTFGVVLFVRWVFSLFLYIAKARMADTNSLIEGLKIHKVFTDIKQIGVGRFFGWYFAMAILVGIIGMIALLLLNIPYFGAIVGLCIVIPLLCLIYYYSLGLLYSNSASDESKDDELDFNQFEKELEYLKYGLIR